MGILMNFKMKETIQRQRGILYNAKKRLLHKEDLAILNTSNNRVVKYV
jgi:hypothetical protein